MAETNPSARHSRGNLAPHFITFEEWDTRPPLPGDTLTGLWPGELDKVEYVAAQNVQLIDLSQPPSFLNKSIKQAVLPRNFTGKFTDGVAIFLETPNKNQGEIVNVAYGVALSPPYRGLYGSAVKTQYRSRKVNKDTTVVERELVSLNLEPNYQEAFERLADKPSEDDYMLAVHGILRAVNASEPFSERIQDGIIHHDANDMVD